MRAVVLEQHGVDPLVTERPVPVPAHGEVRVALRSCGICGSDIHIIEGSTVPARLPITLGHEASGIVDLIGEGVEAWKLGDRVTVNPMISCGMCRQCMTGRENLCPHIRVMGLAFDGAHADYFVVPARSLVRLPDAVPFELGAIVADSIATPLRAITLATAEPITTAAVFGLGGLGLHAALLLKQIHGAYVIGVDASDAALERAASFGIDEVIDARTGRASERIQRLTDGGVDAAFEFVGSVQAVEQAARSLAYGGRCVVAGVGADRLALSIRQETLVARGLSLIGSHGYVTSDIEQILSWLEQGQLKVAGTVSHTFDLAHYRDGLQTLRDRSTNAIRVVITP